MDTTRFELPTSLSEQGRRLLESAVDRHDEAIEVLRHGVAAGEVDAPMLLARAYLGRGRRREAADLLEPIVAAGRVELAGLLAETLAALGEHDAAESAYVAAVAAGDLVATNDYGVFLRDRGRPHEAAHVLRRAARAGDELAPSNLVAVYLEELDDLASARRVAEAYADERRPSTLVGLADVRLATGRAGDAERLYRRAAELGAHRGHVYYGWFLQDTRGDLAGAEREYRLAQRAGEPGWAYNLGRFLLDTGRAEEGQQLLEYAAYWGDAEAAALLDADPSTDD